MKKILISVLSVLLIFANVYALNLARVKTWSASEILTAADLNAEFNNILNHGISDADISASAGIVASKLNLAVPGIIGGTTPNTGSFSNLVSTTSFVSNGTTTIGDAASDTLHINANTITFEGATADDNETTLAFTDPTADRTFRFPDASPAQGDIVYGSATGNITFLAKNTTATRYLANTGTDNNPAWAQVNVANGITGTVPTANGGTGSTANANAANGVVVLDANSKISVAQLGAWASKNNNEVYQAATDGFVTAFGGQSVAGYTDGSNPPTTIRIWNSVTDTFSDSQGVCFPVRKNDYWKVTGAGTVYWIPLGS